MNWYNLINPERTEIVFATRNKAFGGYVIRNHYEKNVLIALFIAMGAIAFIFFLPMLLRKAPAAIEPALIQVKELVVLTDPSQIIPPPVHKTLPPIKPPGNSNPRSGKFTVPIVTTDTVIDLPPSQGNFDSTLLASTVSNPGGNGTIDIPGDLGPVDDNVEPRLVVDEMPSFPGGENALLQYLANNIKFSKYDREVGTQGKVYIKFTIDKNGNVTDVNVLRGIGGNCDNEAVRVVSNMPKWRPGRQQGNPVAVYYILPVNFVLK